MLPIPGVSNIKHSLGAKQRQHLLLRCSCAGAKSAGHVSLSLGWADSCVCQPGCCFLLTSCFCDFPAAGFIRSSSLYLCTAASTKWVQLVGSGGVLITLRKVLGSVKVKCSDLWKMLLMLLDSQRRDLCQGCWNGGFSPCKHSFCLVLLEVADATSPSLPLGPCCWQLPVTVPAAPSREAALSPCLGCV